MDPVETQSILLHSMFISDYKYIVFLLNKSRLTVIFRYLELSISTIHHDSYWFVTSFTAGRRWTFMMVVICSVCVPVNNSMLVGVLEEAACVQPRRNSPLGTHLSQSAS
jgi:hypothetical protein